MIDDLRSFIKELDQKGELKRVDGANWDLEISTIHELMVEREGPVLLFDNITGYPKGYRIVTNLFLKPAAMRLGFNLPQKGSAVEAIRYWKDKANNYKPVPVKEVDSGPVMENVIKGNKIDILRFPVPRCHEEDGGRYIGTGAMTITRDLDEEWVNIGTYRGMVHDRNTVGFCASAGKHATIMREKYWAKGQQCPVVVCYGQEPLLFGVSAMPLSWGVSEYEFAGYMKGKPIEVIRGEITGLPIPATAEIAIEGFSPLPSEDSREEGPFGEWTGYYGSGARVEPVIHIKAIYHRNDPILYSIPSMAHPNKMYAIPIHPVANVWNLLERTGMQGVKSVWCHGTWNTPIIVVAIEQRYHGHAWQVATAASLFSGGAAAGRYVIVVDDDIDPTNWDDVLWAICFRCDPGNAIDIIRGFQTSLLDPMLSPEKRERNDVTTAKVIVNACKPYHWFKQFPGVSRATKEMKRTVIEKWGHLFSDLKKGDGYILD